MKNKYPKALMVQFTDEIIHYDKKWFKEFALLYAEKINLPWRSYASIAIIDEEVIHYMALSNCYRVNIGIEAGSERIRKKVYHRPNITNEQIIKRIALLKQAGIGIHASNLFGAPTETIKEMIETLLLNAQANVDIPVSGIVVPYKSTKLYDIAKDLNCLGDVVYNNYGVSINPVDGTSKKHIEFLREYTIEIVKLMSYFINKYDNSKPYIDFITDIISNQNLPFDDLLMYHDLFFKGKSIDLIYEKMESKFGREKTIFNKDK